LPFQKKIYVAFRLKKGPNLFYNFLVFSTLNEGMKWNFGLENGKLEVFLASIQFALGETLVGGKAGLRLENKRVKIHNACRPINYSAAPKSSRGRVLLFFGSGGTGDYQFLCEWPNSGRKVELTRHFLLAFLTRPLFSPPLITSPIIQKRARQTFALAPFMPKISRPRILNFRFFFNLLPPSLM